MSSNHNGLSPVLFESVSAVTATPSVQLGTRVNVGGNDYVYVYNDGGALNKGNGAIVTGTSGYSVHVTSVTMTDFALGICRNATIAAGSYGWLMTRGFSDFNAGASDSFAVGNPIALAVDGLFANKTISTGYITPHVGRCLSACASGLSAAQGFGYFNFGG